MYLLSFHDDKHVVLVPNNFQDERIFPAGKFPLNKEENAMIKVMLNIFEITVDFILSFRLDRRWKSANFGK